MKRFLAGLALAFLVASPTIARPGGPVLSATSAPAGGASYTVTGTGFEPGPVPIQISEPGCCRFFTVTADASGGFTFTQTTTDTAGAYRAEAYERARNGHLRSIAFVEFEVSP